MKGQHRDSGWRGDVTCCCSRNVQQRVVGMAAQEAVEAVVGILGMAPCDGTDAVPPNARSHTVLLAGTLIGDPGPLRGLRRLAGGRRVRGVLGCAAPVPSRPRCGIM